MKYYSLFFKNSNEAISKTKSSNLNEAIDFFCSQKRLPKVKFNELFEVKLTE